VNNYNKTACPKSGMEEKRGIKNFEATHSGGDRADAEEAGYTANSAIASGNSPRTTPSSHPVELRASSLNHQYKHHESTPFVPQFPQPSFDLHYYPFRSTPRSLLDPHMRRSCTHVVLVTHEESINLIQCMDKVLVL
jgi:hypothetical protein